MKIPANNLSRHLEQNLLPCYLIAGDELLLVQEALDAIRKSARENGFDSRDLHVQMQGFNWQELADADNNLSLFAQKRIVELRLTTGKPGIDGGAAIAELAEKAGGDLLFLISAPKLDKRTTNSKWVRSLEAKGAFVQVWPVALRELPAWIAARMKKLGLQPDREAVRIIADRVEGNLLAAQQEIEKLRLLLGEGTVTADDVNMAVVDSSRYDVYQLVDAALGGDPKRALRILSGIRAEGVDAVVVIWALTRELRVLAKLQASVEAGQNLAAALQKARVWRSRENLFRTCINRHRARDVYWLIQASQHADAVAKGQAAGDKWQLATNIVWQLSAARQS
ncbi:MAG: DNA polymerase III subunit delta [Proteobacteria bacterium]|nr:DNA polymerase III subunit delta [Pseudomonadota bacterium]